MRSKPEGAGAVMAGRAKKEVATDTPEMRLARTLDFFPTPPWAARAGAELVLRLDPEARVVREPACGRMQMAGPLAETFEVLPSDVHAWEPSTPVRDWLDADAWPAEPDCDWVVTNPPFAIGADFIRLGLQRARRGVALLMRLAFVEGVGRYDLLAGSEPLTLLAPFSERVPMTLGKWSPDASTATAYAWFLWRKGAAPMPTFIIPPGTRARLWQPDDARTYGHQEPMTLFGEMPA